LPFSVIVTSFCAPFLYLFFFVQSYNKNFFRILLKKSNQGKKEKRKGKEKQEKTKRIAQTSLLADYFKPRISRTAENQWPLHQLQVSIRSTIVPRAERVGASLVSHTLLRSRDLSRTTATRQTLDSRWNFAAENLSLQKW